MGSKGTPKSSIQVEIGEVWSYNDETKEYLAQDASNTALLTATSSKNGDTCSCSNYLREVEYTVELNLKDFLNSDKKEYELKSVKANIVIGANLVQGKCGEHIGVP